MAFCDFVVKYDDKMQPEELTKCILYSVWLKRLKAKKPAVIFIGGDSGEGKSESALKLQQILLSLQGLDLKDYVNDINVYTPLQYPQKLEALLFDKRLKKVNFICMHEAREIVKAKNWQSFLTQAIGDCNAMSRSIKRLGIFIISQFIRDITSDIRYTLNYYCIVRRPKNAYARLYINVLWKDDRDLEKPKLRKRKLSGYLLYPNGKYKRYVPQYLELKRPSKEVREIFEKEDYEAKAHIIRNKLNRLLQEMKQDIGEQSNKVTAMVEWYIKNDQNLNLIGRRVRNKLKLSEDFKQMHDLTKEEAIDFEKKLNVELGKRGRLSSLDPLINEAKEEAELNEVLSTENLNA